jgi:hypothetical protein
VRHTDEESPACAVRGAATARAERIRTLVVVVASGASACLAVPYLVGFVDAANRAGAGRMLTRVEVDALSAIVSAGCTVLVAVLAMCGALWAMPSHQRRALSDAWILGALLRIGSSRRAMAVVLGLSCGGFLMAHALPLVEAEVVIVLAPGLVGGALLVALIQAFTLANTARRRFASCSGRWPPAPRHSLTRMSAVTYILGVPFLLLGLSGLVSMTQFHGLDFDADYVCVEDWRPVGHFERVETTDRRSAAKLARGIQPILRHGWILRRRPVGFDVDFTVYFARDGVGTNSLRLLETGEVLIIGGVPLDGTIVVLPPARQEELRELLCRSLARLESTWPAGRRR